MSTKLSVSALLEELAQERFIITASGSSMVPTIVKGDRIHLRRPDREPQVGDIVLCKDRHGTYIIHRVTSTEPRLLTQGDASAEADDLIEEVLGLVTCVEKTWRSRLRRITLKVRGASLDRILKISRLGS